MSDDAEEVGLQCFLPNIDPSESISSTRSSTGPSPYSKILKMVARAFFLRYSPGRRMVGSWNRGLPVDAVEEDGSGREGGWLV